MGVVYGCCEFPICFSAGRLESAANELTTEVDSLKAQNARMGRELESLRVEKHLWSSARTGIHDELTLACERADKEREAHEQTRSELQTTQQENVQLRARVVELEREAASLAEQREQLDSVSSMKIRKATSTRSANRRASDQCDGSS